MRAMVIASYWWVVCLPGRAKASVSGRSSAATAMDLCVCRRFVDAHPHECAKCDSLANMMCTETNQRYVIGENYGFNRYGEPIRNVFLFPGKCVTVAAITNQVQFHFQVEYLPTFRISSRFP